MHKTILVSSFLSEDKGKIKLRYFERLDAALRKQGYRLFLLNTQSARMETECDATSLPLFIEHGHHLRLDRFVDTDALAAGVRQAASIDAEQRQRSIASDAVRVLFYRAHLRTLVRSLRPALCVFWHQFSALHHSMPDFCEQSGMSMLFMEYGLLPGTISLDREGQMAESWIARQNEDFLGLPVVEADFERATALLERLRAERIVRVPGPDAPSLDSVLHRIEESGRALVFYAGQHDYRSGMVPRTLPNADLHSPFFDSTVDALRELCAFAEERDAHILFKPHPLVQIHPDAIDLPYPDRVDFVPGADIFQCMEAAEVVVTILSQVSYMALLHDRPCVLLGRNQISGKSCVYEIRARDGLGEAVADAIALGFTEEQRAAWLRHAAQLCRHALFAFDEPTEADLGRGTEETAAFLIDQANEPPEGSASRGNLFGEDLSSGQPGRTLSWAYRLLHSIDPLVKPVVKSFHSALSP